MTDPAPHLSPVAPPAPAQGVGVRVTNAHLDYDGQALFTGLDMRVPAGGWTCVLGPSGVGKTTLLRMIAGLAAPAADTRIAADDGKDLAGRLAWMAQQDLLLPWLGALDNVMLGARLRHERPAPDRARALLARVGLGGREAARPAALSGGQRQRVALARTLMEDRPVVLMDEPFSALDTVTRSRLQDLAATLLKGRTVMLVTHDPLEALRLGDAVHVMAGRPAVLDAPLEPEGAAPRDVADPALLRHQAELLARLRAADAAMEGVA